MTLVTARRDAYVAGFALLAAMGEAEARDLGLEGGPLYDPGVNYARYRGSLSDYDTRIPTAAAAGSTRSVPAQNAVVTRPLEPMLQSDVDRSTRLTTGADTRRP